MNPSVSLANQINSNLTNFPPKVHQNSTQQLLHFPPVGPSYPRGVFALSPSPSPLLPKKETLLLSALVSYSLSSLHSALLFLPNSNAPVSFTLLQAGKKKERAYFTHFAKKFFIYQSTPFDVVVLPAPSFSPHVGFFFSLTHLCTLSSH